VIGRIAGGLLAVPFVAVMNTAIRSLLDGPEELYEELQTGDDHRGLYQAEPDHPDPGRFDVAATLMEATRKRAEAMKAAQQKVESDDGAQAGDGTAQA
jgi:putative heme transporter